MLQFQRISRPKKSISQSLILQNPPVLELESTIKVKEHFQHLRQKLKAIPYITTPVASPTQQGQPQQRKRRDKKGKKYKQEKTNFQLEVSSISSSITDESIDKDIKGEFLIASDNLKKLCKQPNQNKNNSSFINSPLYPQNKQESQKMDSSLNQFDNERVNINFVKSLQHNSDCKDIQEYYEDGNLNIYFQSKDMLTFLRYEHEAQEMIQKSKMFCQNQNLLETLQNEIEIYEQKQVKIDQKKEEQQREFIQRILLQEEQKQNFLKKAKTKKIGQIANKFIEHHNLELNHQNSSAEKSRRRIEELQK
ncbi:unnamed protein product (macronuclear) [Paramecium tetraurelia]|uniref:Uncharacterized protein n=1 Tax=Paramecium tetraurelia TaxID=5888 RepID=A0BBS1_PARTE|nr:uncharacterized protein GSPATT00000423001 [Paramecium tetraurelia]CAK55988.1 unnamed protein product [Paramecium tetraurelia]|eukprot:XP_001423386.1 hypothetical protein (macronuclear) [Paramecium tetraurelia strain d4-2]